MIAVPKALNAGTTYGVDHSAENHFGLGDNATYLSPTERMNASRAQAAAKPSLSVWVIGALALAAVVLL